MAMKEVLPVLFSPMSKVSGAKRTVCSSWKHRKFLSVIFFMSVIPYYPTVPPKAWHLGVVPGCRADIGRKGRPLSVR